MKKIFKIIGIAGFTFFGFFITEKTALVVNEKDTIMYQIKKDVSKYNKKSIDASIVDNTVIPGIYGRRVNINKSYRQMKKIGLYDDSLYVYDNIKPNISSTDYLDHYIVGGNATKNMVSLLFMVNKNNISDIINIVGNTPVNFIVNRYWLDENINLSKSLIEYGHNILISTTINNTDTINKLNQTMYCYNNNEDSNFLNVCVKYGFGSISKVIEIGNNPLLEVKEKLLPGTILVFNINDIVKHELPNIIEYIKSKGFEIANINTHLNEDS